MMPSSATTKKQIARTLILIAMSGLASADEGVPLVLQTLQDSDTVPTAVPLNADANALRPSAIREAAETMGFQSAVRWRYLDINGQLENVAEKLDRLFDFKHLLMNEGRMLPPVITAAFGAETLKSDNESTASDTTYEINEEAKIVISPPSWRDYLIHDFSVNNELNPVLKPKDSGEEAIWKVGVQKGWHEGVKHADELFQINMNKLARDYRGMIRFHLLAEQSIVQVPKFAVGNLGVMVHGKMLDVGQRVFQITEPVKFQDARKWKLEH